MHLKPKKQVGADPNTRGRLTINLSHSLSNNVTSEWLSLLATFTFFYWLHATLLQHRGISAENVRSVSLSCWVTGEYTGTTAYSKLFGQHAWMSLTVVMWQTPWTVVEPMHFSSPLLTLLGRLDNAAAPMFCFPGRYVKLKSYVDCSASQRCPVVTNVG